VARALGTLPLCRTHSPARTVLRQGQGVDARGDPETEERLLAVGRAGTAAHVERIVRGGAGWTDKAEAREPTASMPAVRCTCIQTRRHREDPRAADPEVGALLMKALAAAPEVLYHRRADQAPEPSRRR